MLLATAGVILAMTIGSCASHTDSTTGAGQSMSSPSATGSTTAESKQGTLRGSHSPLMGVDLPAGSYGVWIVNAPNDTGTAGADDVAHKPSRRESWAVPMSYEKTVAAMTSVLHPGGGELDGIPWLKEATEDKPPLIP
jgi:hypothetical protein